MPKLSFQYVRHLTPESLLEFLTRRFRYHSAQEWDALVRQGRVTVNRRSASPATVLETRDRIVYDRPPGPEPPVDARYHVVHEDEHLLAVSKSGNMPTSPSGKYWDNCLVHLLIRERGLPELYAVHRLDRETSGINLFAKSRTAARLLGRAFHQGLVGKRYAAILRGHLPPREIYLSAPLRDAVGSAVHIRQEVHPEGRVSRTRFTLRAILPGASLVEVEPLTGRTHQIRAHAAFLGYPVWGDRLYGAPDTEFIAWVAQPDRDTTGRQLLHATTLRLTHPLTGQLLELRDSEACLLDLYRQSAQAKGAPSGADSLR
jgi:RluA family pseudouridine synthase